jgi:hypothetical protein
MNDLDAGAKAGKCQTHFEYVATWQWPMNGAFRDRRSPTCRACEHPSPTQEVPT